MVPVWYLQFPIVFCMGVIFGLSIWLAVEEDFPAFVAAAIFIDLIIAMGVDLVGR